MLPFNYQPFSYEENIEKMVRRIIVFIEQETLEITLLPWEDEDKIYKNYPHWVKYVSTLHSESREVYLYWDSKIEQEFQAEILKNILNKPEYLKELDHYFNEAYGNFKKFTDSLFLRGKNFYVQYPNQELANLFLEFSKVNRKALAAYYIAYDLTFLLTDFLKKETEKFLFHSNEFFTDIATLAIPTIVKEERKSFLKKLRQIQAVSLEKNLNHKPIQELIFQQWYDFGSCTYTHDFYTRFTLEDYQKRFLGSFSQDVKEELAYLQKTEDEEIKRLQELFRQLNEFPYFSLIFWMRKMMTYRNRESVFYYGYFAHCKDFFEEIARRLIVRKHDLWFLSKQEIIQGLLQEANVRNIIQERKENGFTIKQVGNEVTVFTGVKKEDYHELAIPKKSHLRGFPAYRGKENGIVKVIINPKDQGNAFQEGEILVTSMTTPEFVPLMKKAGAIITDEGGLLCHAAIVAREMKKPCIIGTRIATKILKDKDIVEVDATAGIIKILERKSNSLK